MCLATRWCPPTRPISWVLTAIPRGLPVGRVPRMCTFCAWRLCFLRSTGTGILQMKGGRLREVERLTRVCTAATKPGSVSGALTTDPSCLVKSRDHCPWGPEVPRRNHITPQGLAGRKELNPRLWIPPDLHLGLSRAALPIKASWARLQGPGILLPQRSLSWGLWDHLDPLGPAFQLPPVA